MVPSLRGGAWGRVSSTALPGASWGRLVAEYNTGSRGLQDAFGPGFILSQVTVLLEEVFLVTPCWVDKMAPDIIIPLCIWQQQWVLTVYLCTESLSRRSEIESLNLGGDGLCMHERKPREGALALLPLGRE